MLFFLVGTMVGMFLEMGLPSLRKRAYDPAIAEGYIGICVSIYSGGEAVTCGRGKETGECIGSIASLPAGEQKSLAEKIMNAAGALRIVTEATS